MKLRTQLFILILCTLLASAGAVAFSVHGLKINQPPKAIPWPDPPTSPPDSTEGLPTTDSKEPSTAPPTLEQPPASEGALIYFSNGNGTCALIGIGTYEGTVLTIPEYAPSGEKVTSIAARALYGCATLEHIQLPRSVHSIGEYAFANCRSLAAISVHSDNPAFCDVEGVLYSIDRSALILYPPRKLDPSVTLPGTLTEIRDMAFYNCIYLSTVLYRGSAAEWQEVILGSKNYSLLSASLVFLFEEQDLQSHFS